MPCFLFVPLIGILTPMNHASDAIAARLRSEAPSSEPRDGLRRCAVALVLNEHSADLHLLLIHRSNHPSDPWSGNIGLPGGKIEPSDSSPRHAAERETLEEIGLELAKARYLGFLTEIIGANLPVRVACFVYCLNGGRPDLRLSNEVQDAFWVSLEELSSPENQTSAEVIFDGIKRSVPGIDLNSPDKPIIWGITHRLIQQFLSLKEDSCTL